MGFSKAFGNISQWDSICDSLEHSPHILPHHRWLALLNAISHIRMEWDCQWEAGKWGVKCHLFMHLLLLKTQKAIDKVKCFHKKATGNQPLGQFGDLFYYWVYMNEYLFQGGILFSDAHIWDRLFPSSLNSQTILYSSINHLQQSMGQVMQSSDSNQTIRLFTDKSPSIDLCCIHMIRTLSSANLICDSWFTPLSGFLPLSLFQHLHIVESSAKPF